MVEQTTLLGEGSPPEGEDVEAEVGPVQTERAPEDLTPRGTPRCNGTTTGGKRCRKAATTGSPYCGQHQPSDGKTVARSSDTPAPVRHGGGMDVEALMHVAVEKGSEGVEILERLMDLRDREADREARLGFQEAFAEFHRRCPPIPRDTKGKQLANHEGTGKNTLMFAGLETIQRIVDPILHELGFSYAFTVPQATERSLQVRCDLFHTDHIRTSVMVVPIPNIPKASGAQNFTGARTTGKRLTLSDVLGIATEDADASGPTAEVLTVDDDELKALQDLVTRKDVQIGRVLEFAGVPSLSDVPAASYGMLKRFLETRKDRPE